MITRMQACMWACACTRAGVLGMHMHAQAHTYARPPKRTCTPYYMQQAHAEHGLEQIPAEIQALKMTKRPQATRPVRQVTVVQRQLYQALPDTNIHGRWKSRYAWDIRLGE